MSSTLLKTSRHRGSRLSRPGTGTTSVTVSVTTRSRRIMPGIPKRVRVAAATATQRLPQGHKIAIPATNTTCNLAATTAPARPLTRFQHLKSPTEER